jgi:hypothetical protein
MDIQFGKIGDRVIVRSNEFGDPIVGVYTRDIQFGIGFIPEVVDENGKEWICGGIITKYDEELHQFLKKLSGSRQGWYFLCKKLHPDSPEGALYVEQD